MQGGARTVTEAYSKRTSRADRSYNAAARFLGAFDDGQNVFFFNN